jgi:hypothetical protein
LLADETGRKYVGYWARAYNRSIMMLSGAFTGEAGLRLELYGKETCSGILQTAVEVCETVLDGLALWFEDHQSVAVV